MASLFLIFALPQKQTDTRGSWWEDRVKELLIDISGVFRLVPLLLGHFMECPSEINPISTCPEDRLVGFMRVNLCQSPV
jgi:hypothetical protein